MLIMELEPCCICIILFFVAALKMSEVSWWNPKVGARPPNPLTLQAPTHTFFRHKYIFAFMFELESKFSSLNSRVKPDKNLYTVNRI